MEKKLNEMIYYQKYWVILTMVVCAALFWYGYRQVVRVNQPEIPPLKNPAPSVPREYNPGDSLLDLQIERDRERSREIERVQSILDKVGLSDQVRKEAEEELWRLNQATTKEHELETLLKANGFKHCMVTISSKLVSITVVDKLQPEIVSGIAKTAAEVTGFSLDQIQIIEQ